MMHEQMSQETLQQIMESFIENIEHLSNKEYQRRAWIPGGDAGFDETVCVFLVLQILS